MSKLLKACIAMAAFAALAVVPSVASASPELTHPTGTRAPVGLAIQGTNVTHNGAAAATVMTTSSGPVECATATLTGTLTSNTGTHIAGEITTAEFSGTPGPAPGHNEKHCKSPLGNVTVTPSHSSDSEHEVAGSGKKTKSLPWCLTANSKNTFIVRGGKCSEAARPLVFTLHTPVDVCVYSKASVSGTFTAHPSVAILSISKQNFTLTTGSVFLCPNSGELDMAFTLETHEATPTDLYIS